MPRPPCASTIAAPVENALAGASSNVKEINGTLRRDANRAPQETIGQETATRRPHARNNRAHHRASRAVASAPRGRAGCATTRRPDTSMHVSRNNSHMRFVP